MDNLLLSTIAAVAGAAVAICVADRQVPISRLDRNNVGVGRAGRAVVALLLQRSRNGAVDIEEQR